MKFTTRATLAFMAAASAFFGTVSADDNAAIAREDSAVVKLTSDTFDAFIAENPFVLAEFFAPWCGHCKNLGPEFSAAADSLATKHKNIKLAQIDCTEEADLCQQHGIRGYPTLKVFKGDVAAPSDFQGQRKADSIESYMVKLTLPAVQVVDVKADLDDTIKEAKEIIVLQVLPKADGEYPSNSTYYDLANRFREDYTFISTSDADYVKEYTKGDVPGYVVFRVNEPLNSSSVYSGEELEETHLIEFLDIETKPLFGEINGATYQAYMSAPIPLAYYFYTTPEERDAAVPVMTTLGKQYRGEINFVGLDASMFGQHAANLNMKEEFPLFVIHDTTSNKKYGIPQDKELDVKEIGDFVQKFKAGEIEPIVKSEDVPEVQENSVYKLVGKEHEQITKSDKDILVKYYAPWCGHCKRLAPIFEELADLYKTTDDVLVADLDHTLNDIDGVEIEGYPTIVLFPAGSEEPVYYEGSRTLEDFVEFIKTKGSKKVDGLELEEAAEEAVPAKEYSKKEAAEEASHDEL